MVSRKSKTKVRSPELTQQKVIAAFLGLSARFGVAGVTLQQAAKKAGVPFATAHHHFGGGRIDLRDATSAHVARHAQTFISEWTEKVANAGENPLRAYWFGSFEWARLYPVYAGYWLYLYHVLSFDVRKRDLQAEVIRVAQSRIRRLIDEAIGQGRYPAGVSTPENAHNIHSALIGAMILAITDATPDSYKAHSKVGWAGIERWLSDT